MPRTRRHLLAAGLAALLAAPNAPALAAGPQVGKPAPAFSAQDSDGRTVRLSDYAGKTVVLEWTNHDCPFVMKHYGAHAMQALQKTWTGRGVVWLSVISSAPGEQGAVDGAEANRLTKTRDAAPTAVLLDPAGSVGRAYDARTTPHMFVIAPDGTLAYQGGIDDKPSADPADLKTARNLVDAALTELAAGRPVSVRSAKPYGCTVKYAS
ncbi:alkyl hydroperoxide reductase [Methylobacterium sp. Leaf104]|uniref:redoxin domain-containing protein n=1 Tax=Methylobacterium TaxID=407 RepID=UPI0006F42F5D|nr:MULTISPECIES: redoxin domain-containing protein [Methylobacterium]KQP42319.1 alkyl hydroperoxide reductase [Methylobacterium sp. Leaf104]MCI9879166.1 redoxin domain-containing protein [Methylobacterium goesingense]